MRLVQSYDGAMQQEMFASSTVMLNPELESSSVHLPAEPVQDFKTEMVLNS